MSTLIHIPAGHMRFVPAHKQSDGATSDLSPAKWPVEVALIANEKGRKTFLSRDRIDPSPRQLGHMSPHARGNTVFPDTPTAESNTVTRTTSHPS